MHHVETHSSVNARSTTALHASTMACIMMSALNLRIHEIVSRAVATFLYLHLH
jgi:hypothetical protein